MKRFRTLMGMALASTILVATPAHAGFPTFDFGNWIQNQIEYAIEAERERLRNVAKDALAEVHGDTLEAMLGPRGMSDLFNGLYEEEMRAHLPATFNELLNMSAGSDGAGQFLEELEEIYAVPSATDLGMEAGSAKAERYERDAAAMLTTMAASQSAYQVATDRNATLTAMLAELDNAPDLKASIDLQNRIAIEAAFIANEQVRLMALSVQNGADSRAVRFDEAADVQSFFGADSDPYGTN